MMENYSLDITPNKYYILYMVHNKKKINLRKYPIENDIKDLITNEYIKKEGETYALEEKGLYYFSIENKEDSFEQLWKTYPATVLDEKSKLRRIRVDKDTCKKLYKLIITNQKQHDQVLVALKKELLERQNNSSLGFMVELPRYIRKKRWEPYLEEGGDVIERTGVNRRKL